MRKIIAGSLVLLAALGVVFGDIGTSPLYAINQIFFGGQGALALTQPAILGTISLVFWAITLVVSLKYLVFVLVADKEGQGGVFALLGLLEEHKGKILVGFLLLLLLLSAGLLLGEGVMTPAISVLAATEGLTLASNALAPFIIPITLVILTLIFAFQYKGASRMGMVFGPVMVVWFISIALLGLHQILLHPEILWALNPWYGVQLLGSLTARGIFFLFSGVVLAVAGVDALYADLGHFGTTPIRTGWIYFVYPALLLNYFGQGAYLLGGIVNPASLASAVSVAANGVIHVSIFFGMVPSALLYPMILLATLAAVIASQALISGAYSLVAQAISLHYLPRFKVIHTNRKREGQIYLPSVNWFLYLGSVSLVLLFGSSAALAGAYGLAVSAVMFTTTLAMAAVAILWWGWPLWQSGLLFGFFAIIDGTFLVSNSLRFAAGGWVPVTIGLVVFVFMICWNWGRRTTMTALKEYDAGHSMGDLITLKKRLAAGEGSIADERGRFVEAERAVVFLTHQPVQALDDDMPIIIRAYMRRNGAIPKHLILLYIERSKHAQVRNKKRHTVVPFGANVWSVISRFGFMEETNLHEIVAELVEDIPILKHDHFLVEAGAEELHSANKLSWFNRLRLRVFRFLQRLATPTYRYFGIESSTSLSTTTFHIYVDEHGSTIRLPELDLI